ncbi:MAG: hypothetical protein Homavirus8_5 [Homavirus sp.]|uniref:U-box domain-containing protein n=1 Tax=Homavirus sp. TaxID=2487769 RepID=A0A3G5A4U9_9VIRU|nr:MAG: hypothetical protein Homavirus8_5 [Homavirus sp.]
MDIICPITNQIFHTPVLASDGFFYEKQAIENWIAKNKTSPHTRQQLETNLYNSLEIKQYIDIYLLEHPDKKTKQYKPSMDHTDNLTIINNLLRTERYDKLLEYKNFDLAKMTNIYVEQLFKKGNIDAIKHILDNTSYLEYKFNNGWKVIHMVCRHSTPEIIKHLVDKGVNLNWATNDGWTPIHIVCQYSTPEMITYLVDKDIDLESGCNGWKPIHLVCRYNNPEVIKHLVDRGVDLECVTNHGSKPIHLVCQYSTLEMIKYLANKGVDLECADNDGWKPIHFLCGNSTPEAIKYLADKGVDLECVNNEGWKPIHVACHYNTSDVIKYTIDMGVDLKSKIKKYNGKHKEMNILELIELNKILTNEEKNDIITHINHCISYTSL